MLLAVFTLFPSFGFPPAGTSAFAQSADAERSRKELSTLRKRIGELERRVRSDTKRHSRAEAELRAVETAAAASRRELATLRNRQAGLRKERDAVAQEMERARDQLAGQRHALARQLRAAWKQGSAEPLRLMLGLDEYSELSRRVTWSGYLARRRESVLAAVAGTLAAIERNEAELAKQAGELEELEQRHAKELAALEERRRERATVLAALEREQKGRDETLARARREAEGLTRLLRELERVVAKPREAPPGGAVLPPGTWPVEGRLLADFGQPRAGGLKWDGVLISAPAGSPVKAARNGRVVYADWLPGLGLLLVIDHGGGYMSLYGHNQSLLSKVGERVPAGGVIAEVGDSGGRGESALYFEVRRNGRPENPRRWVR